VVQVGSYLLPRWIGPYRVWRDPLGAPGATGGQGHRRHREHRRIHGLGEGLAANEDPNETA